MDIITLTIVVVLLICAILLFGYILMQQYLFLPTFEYLPPPKNLTNNYYIDGINFWHFNNFPNRPTVFFCHGNAGNISVRYDIFEMMNLLNFNLIIFDYFGYGKSIGSPRTNNFVSGALNTYDWCISNIVDEKDVIVWGESLGGAAASSIVKLRNCKALVMMATFSSIPSLIIKKFGLAGKMLLLASYPVFSFPVSNQNIKFIETPTLFLHSREDNLIDISEAIENYETSPAKIKKFIEGTGDHAHIQLTSDQYHNIENFLIQQKL